MFQTKNLLVLLFLHPRISKTERVYYPEKSDLHRSDLPKDAQPFYFEVYVTPSNLTLVQSTNRWHFK